MSGWEWWRLRPVCWLLRVLPGVLLLCASFGVAADWLALCSKCASPTVFSLTGADTANAVAQARMTRAEIEDWCANWQPGNVGCVKQTLRENDLQKVYRASADCLAGRITPIDGNTYQLAGVWDNSDIGGGRSKWRDAQGKIVARDNASGGLGIAQQWEVLCPSAGKRSKVGGARATAAATAAATTPTARAATTPPVAAAAPAALEPEFARGQAVLARYGSQWIRARVNQVRRVQGRNGPELAYDVSLDNGKRGLVPARMLRSP